MIPAIFHFSCFFIPAIFSFDFHASSVCSVPAFQSAKQPKLPDADTARFVRSRVFFSRQSHVAFEERSDGREILLEIAAATHARYFAAKFARFRRWPGRVAHIKWEKMLRKPKKPKKTMYS